MVLPRRASRSSGISPCDRAGGCHQALGSQAPQTSQPGNSVRVLVSDQVQFWKSLHDCRYVLRIRWQVRALIGLSSRRRLLSMCSPFTARTTSREAPIGHWTRQDEMRVDWSGQSSQTWALRLALIIDRDPDLLTLLAGLADRV